MKVYGVIVLLLIFSYTGIKAKAVGPLRISKDIWVGYGPISIADSKGFLKELGLHAQIKVFTNLIDSMRAFETKSVDAAFFTLNEVLMMKDRGFDALVVLAVDYSSGADAIVAQKNISNLNDLKGKTVGVEVGTVGHFTLIKALEKVGLKETDIKIHNIANSDLLAAFASKKIQAAASWEPFISKMAKAGNGHIIFSSKEIPGAIIDVLVVQREVYKNRREDVEKICRSWFKALDYLEKNKTESFKIMGKIHGLTPDEYAKELQGVHLTGREDNRKAIIGVDGKAGTIIQSIADFEKFLRDHSLVKNLYDLDSIVVSDPLKAAL